jgi:hypothetical protein
MNIIESGKKIEFPGTKKTPQVIFDSQNGLLEIKGSSIMEDCYSFYGPLIDWIQQYVTEPADTTVNIELDYFNSASAKILLLIFKTLAKIQQAGCSLKVNWAFQEDDDDIRDSGYDFSKLAKVDFNFICQA